MIELYTFSWITQLLITFLLGISILSQTLVVVLNHYSHSLTPSKLIESSLEISILLEIFILSLLHGELVSGYRNGMLVPAGYENIRLAVFSLALLFALIVIYINKNLLPLSVIVAAGVSLPGMGIILGKAFPYVFILIILFFLARSIKKIALNISLIKTKISALSIIHALDTLPSGVLICERDGYTVLSNYQMQNLMIALTGKVYRNSISFYNSLVSDKYKSNYEKLELEGQAVYLLSDNTAWMFTKTEVPFKKKNYVHISAVDVSEYWSLTSKLREQEEKLIKKSDALKNTILNLEKHSKEKEIENAKMRAHDILGQRLSVLLRMIQNEEILDYQLLKLLSDGLLEELKAEDDEIKALDELKNIKNVFASIGVEIYFKGKLPDHEDQAHLFVDIIREASTNAVRHGFATVINIDLEETLESYSLLISNIGHTKEDPINLGSGLKTIRKKVKEQGGELKITPSPQFTLSVVVPGGGKSDKSTYSR